MVFLAGIDRKLQSIGKKIFVDYYYNFKDLNIDKNVLAKKLLDENPNAEKISGQLIRISYARQIFSENGQEEALRIIVAAKRLDAGTIKNARKILNEEIKK